jgi:hypothetical protein
MVIICTATFKTQTHYVLSTPFIYVLRISEQTAIHSLYHINCLVVITEKGSVYCAVRTELLNIIHADGLLNREI